MKEIMLSAKNLSFAYDNTLILDKVNFSVNKGQFIGIFGPNGGGKTTLLRLLMGFLEPLTGHIQLFGKTPKSARLCMGYVPQIARFDKQFPITAFDIVSLGLLKEAGWMGRLSFTTRTKATKALKKVGLDNKKDAPFGSLSGGEAQRVLIARALVSNPDILFLDEPTASVDATTENTLYDILMDLKEEKTILMVSHNLPAMTKRVDKCLLVSRTVTSLEPEELCQHYAVGLYHPPFTKNKG